jgi:hypothetical protein
MIMENLLTWDYLDSPFFRKLRFVLVRVKETLIAVSMESREYY